jgi:ribA/ribD-fused uncharacterized protein
MREIRFHRPADDWGCLATRSPHRIRLDGQEWPTVQHYVLAQRFAGDDDVATREEIRRCSRPAAAMAVAVRERDRVRADWADVRDAVMYRAQLAKFTQHPDLGVRLLGTGADLLVAHTHGAAYWGDDGDGTGQNMLGRTLMAVREELRRDRAAVAPRA